MCTPKSVQVKLETSEQLAWKKQRGNSLELKDENMENTQEGVDQPVNRNRQMEEEDPIVDSSNDEHTQNRNNLTTRGGKLAEDIAKDIANYKVDEETARGG